MTVQTVLAADLAGGDGLRQPREAGGMVPPRGRRMVQMKRDRPAMHQFPPPAQMIQPRADVRILPRPPAAVVLVKPVDRHNISPPKRHVAANDAALFGVPADQAQGPAHALGRPADPAGQHPAKRRNGFRRKAGNKFLAHKTAAALHPKIVLG
jgi:hypothetical protein